MAAEQPRAERQSGAFLILYALAFAGGMTGYVPLLTLLLPQQIAGVAGPERVEWLAAATIAGALTASVANILFGWASDRSRTRRPWVAAGLACTIGAYALLHAARDYWEIIAAIILYQAALNMMLSPLTAWAADAVPDAQKGRLAGLMAAAPAIAAAAGVLATSSLVSGSAAQFATVCAVIAALVLPLLITNAARPVPVQGAPAPERRARRRADIGLVWVARLLVQIAHNVLFAFLLYYFQSLPKPTLSQADVAWLAGLTTAAALPIALLVGRASDRSGARSPFLAGAALAMSLGLLAMAFPIHGRAPAAGYVVFGCAFALFMALHSVFAMQLLPSPEHRGRDMGIFNLTNTFAAMMSPVLAVALVPSRGFQALLAMLAVLTAAAAAIMLMVRSDSDGA